MAKMNSSVEWLPLESYFTKTTVQGTITEDGAVIHQEKVTVEHPFMTHDDLKAFVQGEPEKMDAKLYDMIVGEMQDGKVITSR